MYSASGQWISPCSCRKYRIFAGHIVKIVENDVGLASEIRNVFFALIFWLVGSLIVLWLLKSNVLFRSYCLGLYDFFEILSNFIFAVQEFSR